MSNLKTPHEAVEVADSNKAMITAHGDLLLEQEGTGAKLLLTDARVTPGFSKNLTCANALTKRGNTVALNADEAIITNPAGEKMVVPKDNNGLCILRAKRLRHQTNAAMALTTPTTTDEPPVAKNNADETTPPEPADLSKRV